MPDNRIERRKDEGKPRISILERVEQEFEKHAISCPGQVEICLGPADTFDLTEAGEADIYIHDGMVFLFIHCPTELHEVLADNVSDAIKAAIKPHLSPGQKGLVADARNADRPIRNQLGCHSKWDKQPDGQLVVDKDFAGSRGTPLIVWEIAVNHEDRFHLLCEGALWLDSCPSVAHVLLIKVDLKEEMVEIYLIKREGRRRAIPRGRPARPAEECLRLSDDELAVMSDHQLEGYFGFRLLMHRKIREGRSTAVEFEINLDDLFAGTLIDVPAATKSTVYLNETLEGILRYFRRM